MGYSKVGDNVGSKSQARGAEFYTSSSTMEQFFNESVPIFFNLMNAHQDAEGCTRLGNGIHSPTSGCHTIPLIDRWW